MNSRLPPADARRLNEACSRRDWLSAAGVAAAGLSLSAACAPARAAESSTTDALKGKIRHSVVSWCFKPMTIPTLIEYAAGLGCRSVELIPPEHWPALKQRGMTCAIAGSHSFARGWNHVAHHAECLEKVTTAIEAAAAGGVRNVITFTGMQETLTDEEGFRNTIAGLKKVIGLAEKKQVNLCLEPLNTRVDVEMKGHPGYQCDTIEWGVRACDVIGSPRMKILFDIYHTQIMQGDVITRIRQFKDYIAHYHTAGVPGRNDLDNTQEINYPAVMQAIVDTGYQGYVGHEFIPKATDEAGQVAALRQAIHLCDV